MLSKSNTVAWLQASVLKFLTAEAVEMSPLETGGVLLGYFAQPGYVPVVLWAGGAGPRAKRSSTYYRPDAAFDESLVAEVYEQTDRRITYLGDWHTHPAPVYCLSRRDKRTLRRIARCRSARTEAAIMLVLIFDQTWRPTMWQAYPSLGRLWHRRPRVNELGVMLF